MKIGVLGLGSIGKRHANNIEILGHEALGYDPAVPTTSRDLVLKEADAVVIATPTIEHLDDLFDARMKDKPILLEKPFGNRWPVFDTAGQVNAVTMMGNNLRFHECVKKMREWIAEGYIGKPLWATWICGAHSVKPPYLRDGVILNTGAHEVDLALYLLGPAEVVCASAHCTEHGDDIADFVLQHESGARSTFHLDYVTAPELREGWIVGDKNRIGYDLTDRLCVLGKYVHRATDSYDKNYRDEMQAFVDRINGKETIGATGAEGLATLTILLDVRKKARLE